MAKSPILVTGAAGGRQGKTGKHVSEMLLARGIPVRAFVHGIDERSDRLAALGAEIFEGDFLDIRSVQRAVQGVSSIYFAYPVMDGLLDATTAMALAAREAGVFATRQSGDVAILARCAHPAHAPELSLRTSLRLGHDRSRAHQSHRVL
jgi:uncharacterized protein YbjT (DUF2867 family)